MDDAENTACCSLASQDVEVTSQAGTSLVESLLHHEVSDLHSANLGTPRDLQIAVSMFVCVCNLWFPYVCYDKSDHVPFSCCNTVARVIRA